MSIIHWPENERPREKLLQFGKENISDAELLAILFGQGSRGQTAIDLGRNLLNRFGSLAGIFAADQQTLCEQAGIGPAKYTLIQASAELQHRFIEEKLKRGGALSSTTAAAKLLISRLRAETVEAFCCLFLDETHHVLSFETLFRGTVNLTAIYPREVVKRCLHHNASKLIIAHNHPSGTNTPSKSDKQITDTLKQALELVGVELLDHFVIGANSAFSMKDKNLI